MTRTPAELLFVLAYAASAGEPIPPDVAQWLNDGLARWGRGVRDLDTALGLTGPQAIRHRNEHLFQAGQRLAPGATAWTAAVKLAGAIRRFTASTWPRFLATGQGLDDLPPVARHLARACLCGCVPESSRRLWSILLEQGWPEIPPR